MSRDRGARGVRALALRAALVLAALVLAGCTAEDPAPTGEARAVVMVGCPTPGRPSTAATANSTFTGSVSAVHCQRRTSRPKWVSTVIPGTPKALPRITLAVFRPIPGSVTRSSSRAGSTPSYRSTSAWPSPIRADVLLRKKPVGLISCSSSARSAAA